MTKKVILWTSPPTSTSSSSSTTASSSSSSSSSSACSSSFSTIQDYLIPLLKQQQIEYVTIHNNNKLDDSSDKDALKDAQTVFVLSPLQEEQQAKDLIDTCKVYNIPNCIIVTNLSQVVDISIKTSSSSTSSSNNNKPLTEKDTIPNKNDSAYLAAESVVLKSNGEVTANGTKLYCVSLRVPHILPTTTTTAITTTSTSNDDNMIMNIMSNALTNYGGLVLMNSMETKIHRSWVHPHTVAVALLSACATTTTSTTSKSTIGGKYYHIIDWTCTLKDLLFVAWQNLSSLYLVPLKFMPQNQPLPQSFDGDLAREVFHYDDPTKNGTGLVLKTRQEIIEDLQKVSQQYYQQQQQNNINIISYVWFCLYLLYVAFIRVFGFGEYNICGAIIAALQGFFRGHFATINPSQFLSRHAMILQRAKTKTNDFSEGVQNYYETMVHLIALGAGQYCHFVPLRKYCTVNQSQEYFNHRTVQQLLPNQISTNKTQILEIGCGQGHLGREIARISGVHATGLTFATNEVELAMSKAAKQGLQGRYNCIRGDYHELPFDDNSFDAVFGIYCLKYSSRLETVLQEMARVCRPGGRVWSCEIVVTEQYDPNNPQHKYHVETISDSTHMPPLYSLEDFRRAGEKIGLTLVCEQEDLAKTHPDEWSPWYSCMERNGLSTVLKQKWVAKLVKMAEDLHILPKKFTQFYQDHLVHPLIDFVDGGKLGIVSGSTVLVWEKKKE